MEKFVKSFCCLLLLPALVGCASTVIPNYIQDKNAYKKQFYAHFDDVYEAAVKTLKEYGWTVNKAADPAQYERIPAGEENQGQQVLLFTEIRQTPMFIGSRYARMNIFIRVSASDLTEIEIRYLTATNVLFKTWTSYRNDSAIRRLLEEIEKKLK